ncbi:endonuclease III domain-containing protein [Desulfurivibrio dismutans]|uniref:endonuclease III domain-containing protein n=1 Tax=Desulfurivibrio dismutans TaxID=1398908 RepID=UPI0023D98E04|nr:endonuclease III domain-containing protein [Desulfurivibrio alkaliphilus]MDF1613370.1 endonuclease III domain-containing protein [Desulfurivibrio alkaliphilus]
MHPLASIYRQLLKHFGPQHWWPGDTPLEIMVGAVLTQNTSWSNVEKAIVNLKAAGLLPTRLAPGAPMLPAAGATSAAGSYTHQPNETLTEPCPPGNGLTGRGHSYAKYCEETEQDHCLAALRELPPEVLAGLIRPAGYYNLKARRLHNLLARVADHHDSLKDFLSQPATELRQELLAVKGIGPETADSICLYAAGKPVFVVDTYTHRIFNRHQLVPEEADYYTIQEIFTDALPADPALYNEYHALIVRLGKEFCRKRNPRCPECPLHCTTD